MVSILVFGVLMAFTVLLLDLETLVQFLFIGTLLAYSFVATTVIVLCFQKFPPFSSPGPASSGLMAKEYNSFQNHRRLMGTEQASALELRKLWPVLTPCLGFSGGYSLGAPVAGALGVMMTLAMSLGCVLVFGDSAVYHPHRGYILLLLLSTTLLVLGLLIQGPTNNHASRTPSRNQVLGLQTVLVPLTAALSILLNTCLMLKLRYPTWLPLSIWLLMGPMAFSALVSGTAWRTSSGCSSQLPHTARCPPTQPGGDSAGHAVPKAPVLEPHFMEQPTSP